MAEEKKSMHGEWSSRWMFVIAASGAAVGLGNIWKFPYITGMNGGGAFVLIYLGCVLLIGIPLFMAETLLGRHGRQNPASSLRDIALASGRSRHWQWVGGLIILAGFLILSYYSVIAGWALSYVFTAASGVFHRCSPEIVNSIFDRLVSNPWKLTFWHSIVMFTTIFIVAKGIERGLEVAVRFMFPIMVFLLLILIFYAIQSSHFDIGLQFLFKPDFSKLTSTGAITALGHAFFTLSLATGSIMMYGAYLPRQASITSASIYIAMTDTIIALLAGMAIFPIVFANSLEPATGPGLIFKTLPIAFGQMPYGSLFATLFFVMLVFAALTSAISLLEPTVAWMIETFHISRFRATIMSGITIWILGFGTTFSFNIWSNIKLFHRNFFDNLDYLTANIMMPLCGLLIAVFSSWVISKKVIDQELVMSSPLTIKMWRLCVRYIAPLAIAIIFLDFIGILEF